MSHGVRGASDEASVEVEGAEEVRDIMGAGEMTGVLSDVGGGLGDMKKLCNFSAENRDILRERGVADSAKDDSRAEGKPLFGLSEEVELSKGTSEVYGYANGGPASDDGSARG